MPGGGTLAGILKEPFHLERREPGIREAFANTRKDGFFHHLFWNEKSLFHSPNARFRMSNNNPDRSAGLFLTPEELTGTIRA